MMNDGLHPDRPGADGRMLPRFPLHQPASFIWDFRATKRLPATPGQTQVILEIFNLLGNDNT